MENTERFERGRVYKNRVQVVSADHHAVCTRSGDSASARFVHMDKGVGLGQFEIKGDVTLAETRKWTRPGRQTVPVHYKNSFEPEIVARNAEASVGQTGRWNPVGGVFSTDKKNTVCDGHTRSVSTGEGRSHESIKRLGPVVALGFLVVADRFMKGRER